MADPGIGGSKGGARDEHPRVQILSISCSFWEIFAKWYVGAPSGGLVPPPRGNPGSTTARIYKTGAPTRDLGQKPINLQDICQNCMEKKEYWTRGRGVYEILLSKSTTGLHHSLKFVTLVELLQVII